MEESDLRKGTTRLFNLLITSSGKGQPACLIYCLFLEERDNPPI